MMTVSVTSPRALVPPKLLIQPQAVHQGGEGRVYFTDDRQYAVKIYHQPSPDKRQLLQRVIELADQLGEDAQFLAWPIAIVDSVDGKAAVGVVTRRVASNYTPLAQFILTPQKAAQRLRQGISWIQYLKMARSVTAAVRTLHRRGMAHADIHFNNFLADPVTGRAILIDLDGLVVNGFLPPAVIGMEGFIAPEVVMGKAKPGNLTDRYSTAVLVLWILLFRNVMSPLISRDTADPDRDRRLVYGKFACFSEHPTDTCNRPPGLGLPPAEGGRLSYRMLTPKLQALTEQTLVHHLHEPHRRPQVDAWEEALAETYDTHVPCGTCQQSFVYPYWISRRDERRCPFCGSSKAAPFPVVVRLLESVSEGHYVPVRDIVLYHGYRLFADVVARSQVPPFTRSAEDQIGEVLWVSSLGAHYLRNLSAGTWHVSLPADALVRPTEGVRLMRGLTIRCGTPARILQVVE